MLTPRVCNLIAAFKMLFFIVLLPFLSYYLNKMFYRYMNVLYCVELLMLFYCVYMYNATVTLPQYHKLILVAQEGTEPFAVVFLSSVV